MISPMALRRTISRLSNRGVPALTDSVILCVFGAPIALHAASRFSRLQPRAGVRVNDLGGRVILGITDDHDTPSAGFNLFALGNALHRVVGALGMKIRTNFANDGAHVLF